jgi:hypothetical protein
MELTENERLRLIEKKEELLRVTSELSEICHDPKNAIEIERKINQVLSILSTIASFAKTDYNLEALRKYAELIILYGYSIGWENLVIEIDKFCLLANSIEFKFTKTGMTINVPKIDLNVIKNEFSGLLKKS